MPDVEPRGVDLERLLHHLVVQKRHVGSVHVAASGAAVDHPSEGVVPSGSAIGIGRRALEIAEAVHRRPAGDAGPALHEAVVGA